MLTKNIIQKCLKEELQTIRGEWRSLYIRITKYFQISGFSDELFSLSALHGYWNCCNVVSSDNVKLRQYEIVNHKNFVGEYYLNTLIKFYEINNCLTHQLIGIKLRFIWTNDWRFRPLKAFKICWILTCPSLNVHRQLFLARFWIIIHISSWI